MFVDAIKAWLRPAARAAQARSHSLPAAPASSMHRRFLSDNPMVYEEAVANAEAYVSRLSTGAMAWLRSKPYEQASGHASYFRLMYDLLNMLQAMQLPPQARLLEVGSGPGWVTEILLMLGHEVDALEPAADMIAVARERSEALGSHYGVDSRRRVRFHKGTMEEVDFPAGTFDAVLYFDVLHHVVDERVAMSKTFRFLKAGGCLGIVEAAWHPDFKDLEASLIAEMKEYGTLENPYSTQYLDHLLADAGFVDAKRFVGVNGFFAADQLGQPLGRFGAPIHGANNVVAIKPSTPEDPAGCDSMRFRTDARFRLLEGSVDERARTADIKVAITNTGETLLDNRTDQKTHVTLALRRGTVGKPGLLEAKQRHLLAQPLKPAQSVTMTMHFDLPEGAPTTGWELDAVAEGLYWFSLRGIESLRV